MTELCGDIAKLHEDVPGSLHAGREMEQYIEIKTPDNSRTLLKRTDCTTWQVSLDWSKRSQHKAELETGLLCTFHARLALRGRTLSGFT